MLEYDYLLFRPPAEANNLILQVTLGCSYNKCNFCSMYKTKKFTIKPLEEIFSQIDLLASYYPDTIKVFLADGDALALDSSYLLQILKYLKIKFKLLRRVSTYASTQNILSKSISQLLELKQNGLTLFYYGIETGNDELLNKINKGVTREDIINSLKMVEEANIKVSATVILGLGGKEFSRLHIEDTATLLSSVKVNYLSTLQLGLEDDAKVYFYKQFSNNFEHLNDIEILKEQKLFLSLLEVSNKTIFRSNHASNALHLEGTLPKDKDKLIKQIDMALQIGQDAFVPNIFRGF